MDSLQPTLADEPMSFLNLLAHVALERHQSDSLVNENSPELIKENEEVDLHDSIESDLDSQKSTEIDIDSQNSSENEGKAISLLQVSKMSDSNLLKLFCMIQANEIKKKFYFTCRLIPSTCDQVTQSFGNEDKARNEMKKHLRDHLRALLQANHTYRSQELYMLRTVVKSDTSLKKKLKIELKPKLLSNEKENSDNNTNFKQSKVYSKEQEKSLKFIKPSYEIHASTHEAKVYNTDHDSMVKKVCINTSITNLISNQIASSSSDTNVSYGTPEENILTQAGYISSNTNVLPSIPSTNIVPSLPESDNQYNRKRSNIQGGGLKMSKKFKHDLPQKLKSKTVSHDHGYMGDITGQKCNDNLKMQSTFKIGQNIVIKEEIEDTGMIDTLLTTHMNNELKTEVMAQDSEDVVTPLPVVGSEVDFNAEDKKMKLEYDHYYEDPLEGTSNEQTVKSKGKFVGQSHLEKELSMNYIKKIKANEFNANGPYTCGICEPPRIFTALSTLTSHYRSHAGIRPYVCTLCHAGFTRQHSLNYHLLIHNNKTRFTCEYCGKKFRHPSHFREHRRRHTGENPFSCPECFQKFKTRNTFKRHLKTRHKKVLTTTNIVKPIDEAVKKEIKSEPENSGSDTSSSNEKIEDCSFNDMHLDFGHPPRHSTPPPSVTGTEGLSPIQIRETQILQNLPDSQDLEETFSATEDDCKDFANDSVSTISIKEGDEDYQLMDFSDSPTYDNGTSSHQYYSCDANFEEQQQFGSSCEQSVRTKEHQPLATYQGSSSLLSTEIKPDFSLEVKSFNERWNDSPMIVPDTSITPINMLPKVTRNSTVLVDAIENLVNMELGTLQNNDISPSISIIPTTSPSSLDTIKVNKCKDSPVVAFPIVNSNDKWTNLMTEVLTLSEAVGKGRQDVVKLEGSSHPLKEEQVNEPSNFSNLKHLSYVALNMDKIKQEKRLSEIPKEKCREFAAMAPKVLPPTIYKYLNADTKVHYVTSTPTTQYINQVSKKEARKNVFLVKYLKREPGPMGSSSPKNNSNEAKDDRDVKQKISANCSIMGGTVKNVVKPKSSFPVIMNSNNVIVLSTSGALSVNNKNTIPLATLNGSNVTIMQKAPLTSGAKSYIKLPVMQSGIGGPIVLQNNNVIINGASLNGHMYLANSSPSFVSNSVPMIVTTATNTCTNLTSSYVTTPSPLPMPVRAVATASTRPQVLVTFANNSRSKNNLPSSQDSSKIVSLKSPDLDTLTLNFSKTELPTTSIITLNSSKKVLYGTSTLSSNASTICISPDISISNNLGKTTSIPTTSPLTDISISRVPTNELPVTSTNSFEKIPESDQRPAGILNHLLMAGKGFNSGRIYYSKYDQLLTTT